MEKISEHLVNLSYGGIQGANVVNNTQPNEEVSDVNSKKLKDDIVVNNTQPNEEVSDVNSKKLKDDIVLIGGGGGDDGDDPF